MLNIAINVLIFLIIMVALLAALWVSERKWP